MGVQIRLNRPEWGYAAAGCVASAANGVVQPSFAFTISGMILVLYDPDPVGGTMGRGEGRGG